jgi:predicted HicB family RNase H-like nuclease
MPKRLSIEIDPKLHAQIKAKAALQQEELGKLIIRLIKKELKLKEED